MFATQQVIWTLFAGGAIAVLGCGERDAGGGAGGASGGSCADACPAGPSGTGASVNSAATGTGTGAGPGVVIFADDFESASDATGNLGLWDDQGAAPANLVITTDPTLAHAGQHALQITAHQSADTGGGPTKWFLPGYDTVFVRFYVKFEASYQYLHHMVALVANQASDKWSGFGTAGCLPSGSNFFVTNIEPWSNWGAYPPPGAWNFYSYYLDMTCDTGAKCATYADAAAICAGCMARGSTCPSDYQCCWGNSFPSSPAVVPTLGQWSCVEVEVVANTAGQPNGSQTMWIDGQKVGDFPGLRWRTDDTLQINALHLDHYVTDDNYAAGQTSEAVWFDDVVVSTGPIGCLP